ncbi:hypothetical protein A3Q56_06917 [Intoshia linei]|uniref:Transcription initiation factor IIA subunit 1 n=1 Tax=Intoshia linei TaxID=1819745 RepID=A0A177AV31_9BILA|nr:hypothetical protein A3Q56_06917 [Intoshia linei]
MSTLQTDFFQHVIDTVVRNVSNDLSPDDLPLESIGEFQKRWMIKYVKLSKKAQFSHQSKDNVFTEHTSFQNAIPPELVHTEPENELNFSTYKLAHKRKPIQQLDFDVSNDAKFKMDQVDGLNDTDSEDDLPLPLIDANDTINEEAQIEMIPEKSKSKKKHKSKKVKSTKPPESDISTEEELNSNDDISDDKLEIPTEFNCDDNTIIAEFKHVRKSKETWRFMMQNGIMSIKGKDYCFKKLYGDIKW